MNRLRLMALAAAAVAAMSGGPLSRMPAASLPTAYFGSGGTGGVGGRRRWRGGKNDHARRHGIPKAFRQYAKRYGSSVDRLVQMHRLIPAPTLDHWRDRKKAFRTAMFGGAA